MTDQTGPPAATIADVSYRNYDGPLHTRALRWWIITATSLRAVRRKPAFWVLGGLALFPYLIIGAMLYFGASMGPFAGLLPEQKYPALFFQAFRQQQFWIFLLTLLVGSGSIAADNQANALLVYLSKPITKEDYLLGKWMGILLPLLGVSCLPALILLIYCALSFTGGSFWHTEPTLLWRLVCVTAVPALLHASLIAGFSAWSKSTRLAGACYAGFYLIGGIVSDLFGHLELRAHSQLGRVLEHLSISGVIQGLGQKIYRVTGDIPFGRHGGGMGPHALPPLWVMLVTVAALAALGLLAARLKVRAVEVVRGMIHLEHASRWYGQVIGVNDITCQLSSGITALLGPNGAGKSTLLKLVTGQLRPTTGRVLVFGEKPFANAGVLRRIGYCPEVESCYDDLTGQQFVTMLAAMSGLSGHLLREQVAESIERVGMTPHASRRIGGYSMGMRQRIKLAQALVHEPELLVLDEPLRGLDPLGRREVTQLLVDLAGAGRGIVVSSHILHEVEQLTHTILLMHRNRLLAQGDIYQIRGLIDAHPHRIAITTRQARALARELIDLPYVLSVRLDGRDEGSLEVETRAPEQFYAQFPDVVRECGFVIDGFDSPDNNLEAVFSYLVDK